MWVFVKKWKMGCCCKNVDLSLTQGALCTLSVSDRPDHFLVASAAYGSYSRNPEEGCYQFCCLVNRGTMGVNSLPKTVTRGCDLNPGPTAPESSTLTSRLQSHPSSYCK